MKNLSHWQKKKINSTKLQLNSISLSLFSGFVGHSWRRKRSDSIVIFSIKLSHCSFIMHDACVPQDKLPISRRCRSSFRCWPDNRQHYRRVWDRGWNETHRRKRGAHNKYLLIHQLRSVESRNIVTPRPAFAGSSACSGCLNSNKGSDGDSQ